VAIAHSRNSAVYACICTGTVGTSNCYRERETEEGKHRAMRPLGSKHHVPTDLIVRRLDWRGPYWGGSLVALRPRISPGLPLSHSPLLEGRKCVRKRPEPSLHRRLSANDRHLLRELK